MAKGSAVSPARAAAFDILRQVEDGAFSSVLLAAKEPELSQMDRALCHELVMGVLRWQLHLDKLIEHFGGRNCTKLDLPVLLALRLGIYQLRFLSRVPASAAVNESVNLVGLARLTSARSFVNAVLRRATREGGYDPSANIEDEVERLAVQTSHPAWLLQRWIKSFGFAEAAAFARANNLVPPTSMRVVNTRAVEAETLRRLREAGAVVEPSRLTKGAWRVAGAVMLMREMAAAGEVYVQDEASQLVARTVNAKQGQLLLDLCAAPGGKATQIADLTNDRSMVLAGDISFNRLLSVRHNIVAQQLKSVKLLQLDAAAPLPFGAGIFDCVLVDAPCSGTGTLRSNPEIRWRLSIDDVNRHATRQKQILCQAAKVVKQGGRLIYSTCSVETEENEDVVSYFSSTAGEFQQVGIDTASKSWDGPVRTWPHRDGSDGFFISAFKRH